MRYAFLNLFFMKPYILPGFHRALLLFKLRQGDTCYILKCAITNKLLLAPPLDVCFIHFDKRRYKIAYVVKPKFDK